MAFADYDFTLAANQSLQIPASGSVVRVRSSSGTLRVSIDGGPGVKLGAGQGFRLLDGQKFRDVTIRDVSGAANSGVVFVGDAGYEDQTFSGSVEVVKNTARRGRLMPTNQVIAAASTVIKYPNANRVYFAIQNLSQTTAIWLQLGGSAPDNAVVGTGLKLGPGDYLEFTDYVHTQSISAISESGNVSVFQMEGE